jgi:hypothetical protein
VLSNLVANEVERGRFGYVIEIRRGKAYNI